MKLVKDWWVPNHMGHAGSHVGRSAVIDVALAYLPDDRRRTVVQAGGHIGIWPKTLAHHFEQVYCWEPMDENWECLIANLQYTDNVFLTQGCLGDKREKTRMRYSAKNTGKHCVIKDGTGTHPTSMEKLDDFGMMDKRRLDAIFLDVEGYELYALLGAHVLIHNNLPLLVIEENGLQARYGIKDGAIAKHLQNYGYVDAEHHGEDVIYVQENW